MQEGMLFHSLYDTGTGLYVELLQVKLTGHINIKAFKSAWQMSLERHSILRSSFIWEGVKEPIQVVHQNVHLPFLLLDWSDKELSEIETRLKKFAIDERKRGFDLTHAPLLRLTLIKIREEKYEFFWTHHHILLDGWSLPILLGEVIQLYRDLIIGQVNELPPTRPFRDYIVWLKGQDLTKSEIYWRKRLDGFTTPNELPTNRVETDSKGEREDFSGIEIPLPETLSTELSHMARRHALTLNTIFQGAWAILLSYYCDQDDIVYGMTVSGRPAELAGADKMVGLFINTLPVRVKVNGNETINQFLKELQADQAEMRQYEYTPLLQIQNWSEIPRGTALFDTLYVFENLPLSEIEQQRTGGFRIETGQGESLTNFPLAFVVVPEEKITIKITFNTRFYSADYIIGILEHFQRILNSILEDPGRTTDSISILNEFERCKILVEWNQNLTNYPADQNLSSLFEAIVQKWPDAPAVHFPSRMRLSKEALGQRQENLEGESDDCLTYAQLNVLANRLAHYLKKFGVAPDIPVGIYMERSIEMVIATLGIIKSGGAYLPIDLSYPAERIRFMLQDSEVSVVLTFSSYKKQLSDLIGGSLLQGGDWEEGISSTIKVLSLDDEKIRGEISLQSKENPDCLAEAGSLAYIMYTSGSTGIPKGVEVIQRGIVRLVLNTNYIQFTPSDRVAHTSNPSFDAATFEIWGALLSGAELVGVPREIALSVTDFAQFLHDRKISILLITTALFNHIAREIPEAFSGLKYLLFGGEVADANAVRQLLQLYKRPEHLINAYGPTEGTCISTCYEIDQLPDGARTVPIGKPIANTQVYVLNRKRQPTPIGVPGELYIGGDGLARGYHNRSELTSEAFFPNPLLVDLHQTLYRTSVYGDRQTTFDNRIYKTGDLVCYSGDGNIHFLGRLDFQVKLHGLRIEIGEVEAALFAHPLIKEGIVLMREDQPGEKRLVAYLVAKTDEAINVSELRKTLSLKLPEYMLPSAYVILEHLPIDPNGKIDRKNLPKPEIIRPELDAAYQEPQTRYEKVLARIWAQVLRVDRVGSLDNFFELGGDSILSLQIIAMAKKEGLNISYRQLFEHPVIQDLAREIELGGLTLIGDEDIKGGFAPLTPVQTWFFEHHHSSPQHFNTSLMVKVDFPLNLEMFKTVLSSLINHHEALRTRFISTSSGWQQVVDDTITLFDEVLSSTFFYQDFSMVPEDRQAEVILQDARIRQASIDLGVFPLMKAVYYDLGPSQPHRLLLIFHHLIFDGVSARIFVEDFVNAYVQILGGGKPILSEKTTTYRKWAGKLFETAQSELITNQLGYWIKMLGSAVSSLPLDRPKGKNIFGLAEELTVFLTEEETNAFIYGATRRHRVSSYVILLTGLVRFYQKVTRVNEIFIEVEGHGREEIEGTPLDRLDVSRTIGWFTSIYPLLLSINPTQNICEQLKSIAQQVNEIPQRGIGYGLLRYSCQDREIRKKISAIPEPAINFNYLGQFDQNVTNSQKEVSNQQNFQVPQGASDDLEAIMPIQIISAPVGNEQAPETPRKATLYIVAAVSGGQLGVRWLYSTDQYFESTIQRYADLFMDELRAIVTE